MIAKIDTVLSRLPVARISIPLFATLLALGGGALAGEAAISEETSSPDFRGEPLRPMESRPYRPDVEPPRTVEEIPARPLEARPARAEEADIPVHHLALPAPAAAALIGAEGSGKPLKVGFNRRIADFLEPSAAKSRSWQWRTLPDGERVTRVRVVSPGAAALRVGVRIGELPPDAELRFFSDQPDRTSVYRIGAQVVRQTVERNRGAGPRAGDDADLYWSPTLEGDTAVVEIRVGPRADLNRVDLMIDAVSHLVVSPKKLGAWLPNAAAACNLDVNCHSTVNRNGDDISNAVARMIFSSGLGSFFCTGTLLADRANSDTPYFLTARHCISTASEASSLETTWFYESSACNAKTQSSVTRTLSGGATLLESVPTNDMTLLRLNEQPPAGAVFAGWQGDARGDRYTAIHHPDGDWKKISFGVRQGLYTCIAGGVGSFFCSPDSGGDSFNMLIDSGFAEQGSSGSGAFKDNMYLVGTLSAGDTIVACNNAGLYYGRFQVGYDSGISKWLENNKLGNLENPQPSSFQSGITVISGWACVPGGNRGNPEIDRVTVEIDGGTVMQASYGTTREDTRGTCGDDNNGFGLLLNMNRLGAGAHTLRALADGQEIGRASFTVTTLGVDYLRGVSAAYEIPNFPTTGQKVVIRWQENLQNFVISDRATAAGQSQTAPMAPTDAVPELRRLPIDPIATAPTPRATATRSGFLENPQPASYLSGITIFSGWACQPGTAIGRVDIEVDGARWQAGYGTERPDTAGVCGATDNGWGLLFNINRFGAGSHTARALVDGSELGRADFAVTTLGAEFLRGVSSTYRLMDFPKNGDSVVVTWQESSQNFAITSASVR